ncbi:hypothetical protein HWV62_35198 [Athelia sp. TMB]|nr:hypothetical protein HWV62_35198 [Athelia sp. TMB]
MVKTGAQNFKHVCQRMSYPAGHRDIEKSMRCILSASRSKTTPGREVIADKLALSLISRAPMVSQQDSMTKPASENQSDNLFESLLPLRILAHATLALIYLPMVVAYVIFEWPPGHLSASYSLLAFVILGILALMDTIVIYQKVNGIIFSIIDGMLVMGLPVCLWRIAISGFDFLTDFNHYDRGDNALDVELGILTLTPSIISVVYFVIMTVLAIIHMTKGIPSLLFDPKNPPKLKSSCCCVLFSGRREEGDRNELVMHCKHYIFRHSYFRKHSFEPTLLAIVRGSALAFACIGLTVFSIYSGFDQQESYNAGSRSIQETTIPLLTAALNQKQTHSPTLSVTSVAPLDPSASIPGDFLVAEINGIKLDLLTNKTGTNSQVWYCPPTLDIDSAKGICDFYPFHSWYADGNDTSIPLDMGFNISWSGPTTMVIWPTVSQGIAWINSIQVNHTAPLVLRPNKQYNILLTITSYQHGNLNWLSFNSGAFQMQYASFCSLISKTDIIDFVDTTGTGVTSAAFSFSPYQYTVVHQQFSSQSVIVLVIGILASIGGIYASLDAGYAIVFGRTMISNVMGSKPISPFGLFGIFAHNYLQGKISHHFPAMKGDLELEGKERGLPAYLDEVAIDTGYLTNHLNKQNGYQAMSN